MQEDQPDRSLTSSKELEKAFSALARISDLAESIEGENDQEIQSALEKSLTLYDQAKEVFLKEDQSWLAAWADIQKASLICELASMANSMGRAVQAHTAMELVKAVLEEMPTYLPSLDLATKLYIALIDTLLRIRSLFNKEDQLEALDNLIHGVAENLGEVMVHDLSFRAEANDLKFTTGILEALADLEEDPQIKKDMWETSQDLSHQVAGNLMISSSLDLSGYEMSQEEK